MSSYLAFSTLPAAEAAGGVFSVVLSPDRSEPSLTATLSYGVRTFLLRSRGGDRLIRFSPRSVLLPCANVEAAIDSTVGSFIKKYPPHMDDTIGTEPTQQTGRVILATFNFWLLTR